MVLSTTLKSLGYVLSVLGIVGFALTIPGVSTAVNVSVPLENTTLTIVSLVVLGIGIFLVYKNTNVKKGAEVPIYHGKEIVGYRRI